MSLAPVPWWATTLRRGEPDIPCVEVTLVLIGTRSAIVISHKIALRRHRLRTPLAQSRDLLGSWLGGGNRTRGGRGGGEQRTTTAPVYCRGRAAVCSAREVGERSVRGDFTGAEWGDTLTLDCGCMNESGEHESKGRRSRPKHDRRGETTMH